MSHQRPEIITAILVGDKEGMLRILRADPDAINAVNERGELNVPMTAVERRLPEFIDAMMAEAGARLNFEHTNTRGDDLMLLAWGTNDPAITEAVSRAYRAYDPLFTQFQPEPDL